jgi:hypothetical protein
MQYIAFCCPSDVKGRPPLSGRQGYDHLTHTAGTGTDAFAGTGR